MKNIIDLYAAKVFAQLPEIHGSKVHLLNTEEQRQLKTLKIRTMFWSALYGVLGVVLLVLPQYTWPEVFYEMPFSFLGRDISLPVNATLLGIALVVVEILAITHLHVRSVCKLALICGVSEGKSSEYGLWQIALEKENREIVHFGIDPWAGLPKWALMVFFIINKLKATLSNLLAKILIKRFLGRVAFRQMTDLAGMPIFAFWNAWASKNVLHQAQISILAPAIIDDFVAKLYSLSNKNEDFRSKIMDGLQYIAILKRNYNLQHFQLTKALVNQFELDKKIQDLDLIALSEDSKFLMSKLLSFGLLIDGQLTVWELSRYKTWCQKVGLVYDPLRLKTLCKAYRSGQGLHFDDLP